MTGKRQRLDLLMVELGLAPTRQRARSMIMAGSVLVDRRPVDKPGALIPPDAAVETRGGDIPFVSRGGLKLAAAMAHFPIHPSGCICLDVGASTGGFTDCLLQHGAGRVYAVDVGYGQMAWKLRQDPRVVVIERTNIRHMGSDLIPVPVDLVTIDVSFISLRIVVPAAARFLRPGGSMVALVKPQFEVGKGRVGKGGVVRDPSQHEAVLTELSVFFSETGFSCSTPLPSPILGPKGNREFLMWLKKPGRSESPEDR